MHFGIYYDLVMIIIIVIYLYISVAIKVINTSVRLVMIASHFCSDKSYDVTQRIGNECISFFSKPLYSK